MDARGKCGGCVGSVEAGNQFGMDAGEVGVSDCEGEEGDLGG